MRSRSAPAVRSAPRVRSSRPAARSARCWARCCPHVRCERKTLLAAGAARRHGRRPRQPVSAVAARRRAAALRVSAALAQCRWPSRRRSRPPCAARSSEIGARVFAMPDVRGRRPRPRARALRAGLSGSLVGPRRSPSRAVSSTGSRTRSRTCRSTGCAWPALRRGRRQAVGLIAPQHDGRVGYDNIERIVSGDLRRHARASSSVAIEALSLVVDRARQRHSGGTLAPLFTIGGGLSARRSAASLCAGGARGRRVVRRRARRAWRRCSPAPRGRSLASVVFAFETTRAVRRACVPSLARQVHGRASRLSVSAMRTSIMTEKIERRGVAWSASATADFLTQITSSATWRSGRSSRSSAGRHGRWRCAWLASHVRRSDHHGFPGARRDGTADWRRHATATSAERRRRGAASPIVVRPRRRRSTTTALLRDAADRMATAPASADSRRPPRPAGAIGRSHRHPRRSGRCPTRTRAPDRLGARVPKRWASVAGTALKQVAIDRVVGRRDRGRHRRLDRPR